MKSKILDIGKSESKKKELLGILNKLRTDTGVKGSAIATRDGLLVVSEILDKTPAETFAAMSAAMLGAAETAVDELNKGPLNRVIIDTDEGSVIATGLGEDAILVTMVPSKADIGLILIELEKTMENITGFISSE